MELYVRPFGLDNPDENVQEWEAENPKAAFISQVAPLAAGTAKAASVLAKGTRYGKWARGLASVETPPRHPFFLGWVVRLPCLPR